MISRERDDPPPPAALPTAASRTTHRRQPPESERIKTTPKPLSTPHINPSHSGGLLDLAVPIEFDDETGTDRLARPRQSNSTKDFTVTSAGNTPFLTTVRGLGVGPHHCWSTMVWAACSRAARGGVFIAVPVGEVSSDVTRRARSSRGCNRTGGGPGAERALLGRWTCRRSVRSSGLQRSKRDAVTSGEALRKGLVAGLRGDRIPVTMAVASTKRPPSSLQNKKIRRFVRFLRAAEGPERGRRLVAARC